MSNGRVTAGRPLGRRSIRPGISYPHRRQTWLNVAAGLCESSSVRGRRNLEIRSAPRRQTLRRVAEQSRSDGDEQQARLAEQAADRGERLSAYLREADGQRMLTEAEDFARRQPLVIAAAGFAVGLGVARALKASSRTRYQRRYVTAYSAQSTYPRRYEATAATKPGPLASTSRSLADEEGETGQMDVGATP